MTPTALLILLALLTVKHFVCDFLYQPPYQWQNKGTYGHPGGIVHALQHACATILILAFFSHYVWFVFAASTAEFLFHYHVDFFKMNINKKFGWTATTHNEFWISLGVDQLCHNASYLAIAAACLAVNG